MAWLRVHISFSLSRSALKLLQQGAGPSHANCGPHVFFPSDGQPSRAAGVWGVVSCTLHVLPRCRVGLSLSAAPRDPLQLSGLTTCISQ